MLYDSISAQRRHEIALDDLSTRRTWAELEDRALRIAEFLRQDCGLAPDDHVALLMENRCEFVELVLGAILAGLWITPVNRHLAAEEIAYVVTDSGCRVLFCDSKHVATAHDCCPPGEGAQGRIGNSRGARVIEIDAQFEAQLAEVRPRPLDPDSPPGGTMIYTSGTSGKPKGVKRARPASLAAYLEAARSGGRRFGLDGTGPHLITGPLYHAAPLLFAIYDQLNGAPMVIMPRWSETEALSLIEKYRITHTHLVPTMFVRLLRLGDQQRKDFDSSSLTLVLHGAAPITEDTKRRMIQWWGPKLSEYWGATEGGMYTLVGSQDWLQRPRTVGRPIESFEVFATDDDGTRLGPGEIGMLYCRHKTLQQPFIYHGDDEKTQSCYLGPSIFTAGDLGHVDEDGFVYLSDRRSNLILSGGVNIYPAEVETVLRQHPAVADVAVFGLVDEEWGETVHAAIEVEDSSEAVSESELLDFARQHLAGYKVPRSVRFTELPRSEAGKVLVRELRERYAEAQFS